jgi:hypothetical protein
MLLVYFSEVEVEESFAYISPQKGGVDADSDVGFVHCLFLLNYIINSGLSLEKDC